MIGGWDDIEIAVERLADKMRPDGSVQPRCTSVGRLFDDVAHAQLPHQAGYRGALLSDLRRWYELGGVPDFTRSRDAWSAPGTEPWLLLFPMRLANATGAMRVDAVVGRRFNFPSEELLRPLHLTTAELLSQTSGWGDNSAVAFPEMVCAPRAPVRQAWAVFFCGRQAERFARFVRSGAVHLPGMTEPDYEACVIAAHMHDRGHQSGPLPWEHRLGETLPIELEAIEELRADLVAHALLVDLPLDADLIERAYHYRLADRSLRFSATNPGSFDDMAGSALRGCLVAAGAAERRGTTWHFDWDRARPAMAALRPRVEALYSYEGVDLAGTKTLLAELLATA